MNNQTRRREELDLAIANMDTPEAERTVKTLLEPLRGIHAVRLVARGAWLDYEPDTISSAQICTTLQQAGFRAGLFQDSETGRTGNSTV